MKSRIGHLASAAQGVIEYLPIPKKWQATAKTSIQAGSAYALIKELPSYTLWKLDRLINFKCFFCFALLKKQTVS